MDHDGWGGVPWESDWAECPMVALSWLAVSMAGRSLCASKQGIARARLALNRRNLTQMALVNELQIASWSTVSKFFTGKPVDRRIFLELCAALDLDWEEVAAPAPELTIVEGDRSAPSPPATTPATALATVPTSDSSALLQTVQQQSQTARQALVPRILERIPRSVVQGVYLPAVLRGVRSDQGRIVPIVAAAGYGKSIILGDLYDALVGAGVPWVGLVLCSSLSLSPGFLAWRSYNLVASTLAASVMASADFSASAQQLTILDDALG